ncbi:MAG TPA: aspartate/glutamate racemase family protein [Burkholderiaceae bacterium]|nr:aspartate/glutamate racemase family protein [Burkholderiaceae bacterium]
MSRPPALGVLMLETAFPRPLGDIGNRNSWPFPVLYETVAGASVEAVVSHAAQGLIDPFLAAGHRLIDRGAIGVTTSCGFLARHQRVLAEGLRVPVASSALLQVGWIASLLPAGKRVGIVTFDADALDDETLCAVGVPLDTPRVGLPPDGRLRATISGDRPALDRESALAEVVHSGRRLCERNPEVAAIVLECTNLPPYRAALAAATGRPVYDIGTLLPWFWHGLSAATPPG